MLSNGLRQRRKSKSQETSPNDSQINIDSTDSELNDHLEENRSFFYQWIKRINTTMSTMFSKLNSKRSFLKKNNSVNVSNDNSNVKNRTFSIDPEDLNFILQNAFEESAINQVLSTDY